MTKKAEQPVAADAQAKQAERPSMDGAGEFPVIGYEPLVVPEGVTLVDLLRRIEALEAKK